MVYYEYNTTFPYHISLRTARSQMKLSKYAQQHLPMTLISNRLPNLCIPKIIWLYHENI